MNFDQPADKQKRIAILRPDGEWINEAVKVFKCNKVYLQMEIIDSNQMKS